MRQNVPNVDATKSVVDFGDQPVLIAFDMENCPFADRIRARKSHSDVRQAFPCRLLTNAKPRVERPFELSVLCTSFVELLAANDVHAATRKFALCEIILRKLRSCQWF
jgi:hypothetical protein